jgi:hypothetical protein
MLVAETLLATQPPSHPQAYSSPPHPSSHPLPAYLSENVRRERERSSQGKPLCDPMTMTVGHMDDGVATRASG